MAFEPLLLVVMKGMIESNTTNIKTGHALGARNETRAVAHDFQTLSRKTDVPMPSIEKLNRCLDPRTEPVPDGSAEIPVD